MKIKFGLGLIALMWSVGAAAQAGYYEGLRYRNNDPFVFCTQGQRNASRCWMPTPPYTGSYMIMPYCHPNPKGKPWSQADYDSLAQYLRVCPAGEQPGNWQGSGRPENSGGRH